MSTRANSSDASANRTETLLLGPPVNVASRLRKARLQKQLFGVEHLAIKIDRFTLLERVGSGGMGEIYAAYDERLDRKVAIKLVRADAALSAHAQARLLREARALAKLSHPNVVQVYEADTFEGQVFIAMEFVRGTTLRRWLEEHAATLTGRARTSAVLNQFLAIGRGLAAAHAAGVVHRDFKPDNVLVGADGRPRVADFGLARAVLDEFGEMRAGGAHDEQTGAPDVPDADDVPQLEASVASTTHGRIVGTPRYMSPEQMRAEPADSRSDQFSFCVALYHALYDEWPFAGKTVAALMLAVDSGEVAQASRSTTVPAAVRKALLRGLARDPDQRFPDMNALLDALEVDRHRMHRRMVAISGVALSAAVGIAVYSATLAPVDPCVGVDAPMAELWNPQRRETLETAFTRTGLSYAASAWSNTAARIDMYADRWSQSRRATCEAAQVRREESAALSERRIACLDRGLRRLDALLDAFADIDAGTVQYAGRAVAELPDLALCENREALSASVAPPEPRVAEAVRETRGLLAKAQAKLTLGNHRDAASLAREALARAETVQYDPVHAEALYTIGWLLVHHGTRDEVREGEAMMMRASNLAEGARCDDLLASIWNHLTLSSYQNYDTTEPGYTWAERALATVRRLDNPAYQHAQVLRHLGLLHYKDHRLGTEHALGKAHHLERARDLLKQAVERLPADVSPFVHAPFLLSQASVLRTLGRDDDALALYQRALDEVAAVVTDEHPTLADIRFDLATLHTQRGERDRAVALMTEVVRAYEITFDKDHPRVGEALLALSGIERDRGNLAVAFEHALRVAAIYDASYPEGDRAHAAVHEHLGGIAARLGRYHDAVAAYQHTLGIRSRHLPPGHIDIGQTHLNLAEALVQLGHYDQALHEVTSATPILAHDQDDVIQAFLHSLRGQALLGKGRHAEAVTELEHAVAKFGDGASAPAESAAAFWALARAMEASSGDRERARVLAQKARDLYATQGESTRAVRADIARWLRRRN